MVVSCRHHESSEAPAKQDDGPARIVPTSLVDQDGRVFGPAELDHHVWITAIMFTSCPMGCPVMAARMGYLQTLLPKHASSIRLLSITIEPDTDTPAVLHAYGERFHRDPALWTFVTGATTPIFGAVNAAYRKEGAKDGKWSFDHAETLALVDGRGYIHGFYRKDDASVARLFADADALASLDPTHVSAAN